MEAGHDIIKNTIGNFGKYQTFILILLQFGHLPSDFQLNNIVFLIPNTEYNCTDDGAINHTNYCPCEHPIYDKSAILNSVSSEWNLICERRSLASLAQSMLQIGILVGSIIYGFISDRYGRKLATLIALNLNVFFITISAFSSTFWIFLVCRFLIGITTGGTILCCYVLIIELSGASFRPYLIGLLEVAFIISYFLLPGITYFVRDWRFLQIATSLPYFVVFFYYWIIPESPRWLITCGRKQEAIEILVSIAKKNKHPTENIANMVYEMGNNSALKNHDQHSYLTLFKIKSLRINIIVCALIWAFCAHSFYGLNQYIGFLRGNLHFNVLISAASLIPTIIVVVLAALYLKRRTCVITSLLMASLSSLTFIFVPSTMELTSLIFAMISQLGVFAAFINMYLFTTEIFPTVVRNSALGFSSMFARVGGLLAPFVVNIGEKWISISIFSTLTFTAAFLSYFLPETKDTELQCTIEEAEGASDNTTLLSE